MHRNQKDKYVSDLESQIQYYKKLLDENGISYDYEAHLRALQSDVGNIVFPELGPEHANLLYSYFKGRQDVYALRSSKKGYYTQCNNFWRYGICPKREGAKTKCQDCPSKAYKELKGRVILQHLHGFKEDFTDVVGLYPLYPDGTCWLLVFDFDNHDESAEPSKGWQQEVNALRQMCTVLGVDALVERSRSGRGAHVWIFFSDPIQASKARRFGEALLRKGAEFVSLKTFTYYDRMMPMQDSLPDGKLGNLIALPLQGRALQNGNSAFVDESWMTYKDQWKRLRETRKLGEKEIDELIRLWCPDDDTMSIFQNDIEEESPGQAPLLFGQSPASRRNFHAEDADDVVKIYLSDGIYVNKTGLKDRMQNILRMIGFGENLGSGFQKILKAWSDAGWDDPQLNNRLDIDEVELVLPLRPKDISQTSQTSEKTSEKTSKKTSETILGIISENPRITVKELSQLTGLSVGGVRWNLDKLADKGQLKRVGPDKGGYWEVINKE